MSKQLIKTYKSPESLENKKKKKEGSKCFKNINHYNSKHKHKETNRINLSLSRNLKKKTNKHIYEGRKETEILKNLGIKKRKKPISKIRKDQETEHQFLFLLNKQTAMSHASFGLYISYTNECANE